MLDPFADVRGPQVSDTVGKLMEIEDVYGEPLPAWARLSADVTLALAERARAASTGASLGPNGKG